MASKTITCKSAKAVLNFNCLSIIMAQQQLAFDPMTFSSALMILIFLRGGFGLRLRNDANDAELPLVFRQC
jgi:hypothetical protein